MQLIVCDASSLIILTKVGLLSRFLSARKGQVVVTPTVAKEAWGRSDIPDAVELASRAARGELHVRSMTDQRACDQLKVAWVLGAGEAETIWLASHHGRALVVSDDRLAIRACRALQISWTSALGILLKMYESRLIDREMAQAFWQELHRHGRYSQALLEHARHSIEGGTHS